MWDLGATYTVHLRLMGKLVGDFLFVLIELFALGVMAEASLCSRLSSSEVQFYMENGCCVLESPLGA